MIRVQEEESRGKEPNIGEKKANKTIDQTKWIGTLRHGRETIRRK